MSKGRAKGKAQAKAAKAAREFKVGERVTVKGLDGEQIDAGKVEKIRKGEGGEVIVAVKQDSDERTVEHFAKSLA